MPTSGAPTFSAEPFTAVTVLLSPVSTSVSLVSTLPAADGSPVTTPLSVTASPALPSATATGASLVPVMAMVSAADEVAPLASAMV